MALAIVALTALAACEAPPTVTPKARPDDLAKPVSKPKPVAPKPVVKPLGTSEASKSLQTYYARVQADLVAQGLMRTDGGGPDTPFSTDMLVRNFEQIAFYDEYAAGQGIGVAGTSPVNLRKWMGPVRFNAEFGASIPKAQQQKDRAEVANFAARLARITGHPIGISTTSANFHVLFMGEDDRPQALTRLKQLVPSISDTDLGIVRSLPRDIHCLVITFAKSNNDHIYDTAVALIRAEHPDLLRKSCIHEELAQGLGLSNDSPAARPSIFNDDDEFSLLTTHDEKLLQMLYDPRLRAGLSLTAARPLLRQIAQDVTGGSS